MCLVFPCPHSDTGHWSVWVDPTVKHIDRWNHSVFRSRQTWIKCLESDPRRHRDDTRDWTWTEREEELYSEYTLGGEGKGDTLRKGKWIGGQTRVCEFGHKSPFLVYYNGESETYREEMRWCRCCEGQRGCREIETVLIFFSTVFIMIIKVRVKDKT